MGGDLHARVSLIIHQLKETSLLARNLTYVPTETSLVRSRALIRVAHHDIFSGRRMVINVQYRLLYDLIRVL